jgi:hypothetical protein
VSINTKQIENPMSSNNTFLAKPWQSNPVLFPGTFLLLVALSACDKGEDSKPQAEIAPPVVEATAVQEPALDLSQRVSKLRSDVEKVPSNADNIGERVDVLWQWANAMSRRDRGLKFAPNLTLAVTQIKRAQAGVNLLINPDGKRSQSIIDEAMANRQALAYVLALFDGYVKELGLREDDPQAFGSLTSNTQGPFPAGSYQTITQTWTVGSLGLEPGGYLMIAQHFMADQGVYQVEDAGADNYVSIKSSNSSVKFKPIPVIKLGQHGGFRAPSPNLAFQLESGQLVTGDTVTITYGDRSGGGKGFKVQTVSNDHYQLPVYISFDESPINSLLDLTAFEVIGKEAFGVHGFVPSVVGVNEPFTLSIRAEDEYFNKASGKIPAFELLLDDSLYAEIPAGTEAISSIENIRLTIAGVYRFQIRSKDGAFHGQSNPVWVKEDPSTRVFWGDTHGHSGFAEGQGSPEGYFRFGRDESKLDFLTLSEHDLWLDDGEWQRMIDVVKEFNQEGEFITYLGYEWTNGHQWGGHHNVLYRTPDGRERTNVQFYPVLQELYRGLREKNDPNDVLIIPHAHQAGYWKLNDAGMETLVEIHSQHGYFEWFGQQYLAEGHHTGFIAASDDHLGHPGYTSVRPTGFVYQGGLAAVRAPERTFDSIFNAMKARQTYATTVDRIILDFKVNDVDMGGVVAARDSNLIQGQVMGTAPIDTISIIKNDREIWTRDYRKSNAVTEPETEVELAFHSQSHSKGFQIDNPRGGRMWYGHAIVEGAELVGIRPGYQNALLPPTRQDSKNKQKVEFALRTRGETRRLGLVLKGADKDTSIAVHLNEGREVPTAPARTRAPVLIPAEDFDIAFADLDGGQFVKLFKVDEYTDHVTFKLLHADAPLDQSFQFEDKEPAAAGDYYFVRVEQANSGIAWSSPVWLE